MLLQEFILLRTKNQEEAVWKHGTYLSNHQKGYLNCDVYQVFDFYVGVYFEIQQFRLAGIIAKASISEIPLFRIGPTLPQVSMI
jgi:hypothetical protein